MFFTSELFDDSAEFLESFIQYGIKSAIAISIARASEIGVAHGIPSEPRAAFIMNINGTSMPPFLMNERSIGRTFLPVAWNIEIIIIVIDIAGQVIDITLKKCWPYATVSLSFIKNLTIGTAPAKRTTAPMVARMILKRNEFLIAERILA